MSYIEENGYFIFGNVKSSDYGVWISGGGTYNAPARRYKEYVVPGRNGTLTIDEGAYEEVEVTYPAFIARDFPANVEAFRNAIMAQNGYVRMTDSYHPDEFYLARYMAGLEVDTLPGGRGGSFELTFKRDPRRFLVSGETPITLGVPTDIQTVSGSIVSIDADADTKITGVMANIDPVQTGSGDPSPENIRPITGHTSVEVTRAGRNLIPYPYYDTTKTVSGITFTVNSDGMVTANGTATANAILVISNGPTAAVNGFTVPSGTYVLTGCPAGGSNTTYQVQVAATSESPNIWVTDNGDGRSVTIDRDRIFNYNRIIIYSGVTVNNLVFKPMLRLASDTDTTYEKYTAQKYITALGRTVYGGTLDVVSGLLTVDKAFATLTGASGEDWRTSTQSGFIGFYLNNTATVLSGRKASGDIAVNEFVRINGSSWGALTAPGQMLYVSNINIRVNNAVIGSTVEELRTWLAENPIEIAYELATPQTYQLTPQEISTLLGTNNIWADTGDVSVEYGTVLSSVENPTLFASKPLIRVTGSGTVGIGDETITIASGYDYVDIDSEIQNCYCGNQNANAAVTFSNRKFPELQPGLNGVTFGADIESVQITPRWYRI